MRVNKNILITILILAYSLLAFASNKDNDNVQYSFTKTDSSYIFTGNFKVQAKPDCLLKICFDYEHIKALAPDATVILIDKNEQWNKISYTYKKYIYFKNTTLWYRTIDYKNLIVNFKLLSSKNNKAIMPQMISSTGYYKIHIKDKYLLVEYYQQYRLTNSSLTKIYLKRAKDEAIEFIYRFYEYSNTICNNNIL